MADNLTIRYSFNDIEPFEKHYNLLREIIVQDTGIENWAETKSLPPIGFPPRLSSESVEKLKGLEGVRVEVLEE